MLVDMADVVARARDTKETAAAFQLLTTVATG